MPATDPDLLSESSRSLLINMDQPQLALPLRPVGAARSLADIRLPPPVVPPPLNANAAATASFPERRPFALNVPLLATPSLGQPATPGIGAEASSTTDIITGLPVMRPSPHHLELPRAADAPVQYQEQHQHVDVEDGVGLTASLAILLYVSPALARVVMDVQRSVSGDDLMAGMWVAVRAPRNRVVLRPVRSSKPQPGLPDLPASVQAMAPASTRTPLAPKLVSGLKSTNLDVALSSNSSDAPGTFDELRLYDISTVKVSELVDLRTLTNLGDGLALVCELAYWWRGAHQPAPSRAKISDQVLNMIKAKAAYNTAEDNIKESKAPSARVFKSLLSSYFNSVIKTLPNALARRVKELPAWDAHEQLVASGKWEFARRPPAKPITTQSSKVQGGVAKASSYKHDVKSPAAADHRRDDQARSANRRDSPVIRNKERGRDRDRDRGRSRSRSRDHTTRYNSKDRPREKEKDRTRDKSRDRKYDTCDGNHNNGRRSSRSRSRSPKGGASKRPRTSSAVDNKSASNGRDAKTRTTSATPPKPNGLQNQPSGATKAGSADHNTFVLKPKAIIPPPQPLDLMVVMEPLPAECEQPPIHIISRTLRPSPPPVPEQQPLLGMMTAPVHPETDQILTDIVAEVGEVIEEGDAAMQGVTLDRLTHEEMTAFHDLAGDAPRRLLRSAQAAIITHLQMIWPSSLPLKSLEADVTHTHTPSRAPGITHVTLPQKLVEQLGSVKAVVTCPRSRHLFKLQGQALYLQDNCAQVVRDQIKAMAPPSPPSPSHNVPIGGLAAPQPAPQSAPQPGKQPGTQSAVAPALQSIPDIISVPQQSLCNPGAVPLDLMGPLGWFVPPPFIPVFDPVVMASMGSVHLPVSASSTGLPQTSSGVLDLTPSTPEANVPPATTTAKANQQLADKPQPAEPAVVTPAKPLPFNKRPLPMYCDALLKWLALQPHGQAPESIMSESCPYPRYHVAQDIFMASNQDVLIVKEEPGRPGSRVFALTDAGFARALELRASSANASKTEQDTATQSLPLLSMRSQASPTPHRIDSICRSLACADRDGGLMLVMKGKKAPILRGLHDRSADNKNDPADATTALAANATAQPAPMLESIQA